MLYINKGDNLNLKKEFHKAHNISVLLYDQILDILRIEELRKTNFNLTQKESKQWSKKEENEINVLEWLEENEKEDVIAEFVIKDLTQAILADLAKFTFHSLNAAKSGHMSVAYSLMRKPFTDELFLLEQMLAKPEDFVTSFFYEGQPKKYDPSSYNTTNKEKKEIIQKAINNLPFNKGFDSDFIFNLRYKKDGLKGLNGISNQAIHIVTNDKHYKTTNKNLNFVFSTEDDIKKYWKHYYFWIPYLLIYTSFIAIQILSKYIKSDSYSREMNLFYTFSLLVKFIEESDCLEKIETKKILKLIDIECPNCKNVINFEKADLGLYTNSELIICPNCFNNILKYEETQKQIKNFVNEFK